eukprot:6155225-Prymnesium_polylepis.1
MVFSTPIISSDGCTGSGLNSAAVRLTVTAVCDRYTAADRNCLAWTGMNLKVDRYCRVTVLKMRASSVPV